MADIQCSCGRSFASARLDGTPRTRCPYCHVSFNGDDLTSAAGLPSEPESADLPLIEIQAYDAAPQPEIIEAVTVIPEVVPQPAAAADKPHPWEANHEAEVPHLAIEPTSEELEEPSYSALAATTMTTAEQTLPEHGRDSSSRMLAPPRLDNEVPDEEDTTGILVARMRRARLDSAEKLNSRAAAARTQQATTQTQSPNPPPTQDTRRTATHCAQCGATLNRGYCQNSNCRSYELPPIPAKVVHPPVEQESSGASPLIGIGIFFLVLVKFLYFFYRGMMLTQ